MTQAQEFIYDAKQLENIMRAYRCSVEKARQLLNPTQQHHKAVRHFGPLRCYWKHGVGWMLDNRPASAATLINHYFWRKMG